MVAKANIFRVTIFGILLVVALAAGLNPVSAQNGTILAVDPAEVSLPLGNQVQLNLTVSDGDNVNAFDVTVTYDAERLALNLDPDLEKVHGGFLDNLSCLHVVNEPGVFELACTQIARPGVSGDGVLLQLVFDTLKLGDADVIISEAEFADPGGVKAFPERQHGLVNILNEPTYTPTNTPMPTHTHTPVVTATATNTTMPTLEPTATSAMPATPTSTLTPIGPLTGPATRTATLEIATQAITEAGDIAATDGLGENPQLRWPAGTATPEEDGSDLNPGDTDQTLESGSVDNDRAPDGDLQTSRGWERLLWGVLIVSAAAIIAMFIIVLRRRAKKSEDYLL